MGGTMDRRKFLKNALLWSAGTGMQIPIFDISRVAAATPSPIVAVVNGKPYDALVEKTLEVLGSITRFVRPGDTVVIKPNIGWDRKPEQAANTHPQVVRKLAELALQAEAGKVKIFDRTCNEKRRCYVNSGIQKEIEAIGDDRVIMEHIDNRKFIPVDIKKGKSLQRWEIYRDAMDADCYINVPVAKHHGLSGLTLGLKNSMGVIGGNRGSLHFSLGQKLADLATVLRPSLTIIDATRMLLRNGPQGGDIDDVRIADTLVATTDPVAADAYATTLFGQPYDQLGSTVAAYQMGLGEMNPDQMQIRKLQL